MLQAAIAFEGNLPVAKQSSRVFWALDAFQPLQ
jgi:hypothetical protein